TAGWGCALLRCTAFRGGALMAMIAVEAEVTALCRTLKLLAVGRDAARLADEACRQGTAHLNYLAPLLEIEHRVGFDSQSRKPEEPRGAQPEFEGHGRAEEDLPF